MARRICVLNNKGGVGKTTTAVNLAAALSREHRVLLIDYDPQSSASHCFGLTRLLTDALEDPSKPHLYNAADFTLGDGAFAPQVLTPTLSVIPATEQLSFAERDLLADVLSGARRLAVATDAVADRFDVIIADCPPALGMLAISAMLACPKVVIPVDLKPLSMPGALKLREYVAHLRTTLQPDLRILGVLGTFLNEATRAARSMPSLLHEIFGDRVFDTMIHTSQELADSAGTGEPIVTSSPKTRAAVEYQALAAEVLSRMNRE